MNYIIKQPNYILMKRILTFCVFSVLMFAVMISIKSADASVLNISSVPSDTLEPLPVELDRFVATTIKNEVILDWYTVHEHNNSGFEVQRAPVTSGFTSIRDNDYSRVGYINGVGNSNIESAYRFKDENVPTGKFAYRLKQVDFNGNSRYFQLYSEVDVAPPTKFKLVQNYPNPFNPVTHFRYELSFDSKVSLTIFDVSGKIVKNVVNEFQSAGYYDLNLNASDLSSGVYYFRLNAVYSTGSFDKTLKMMLVK